MYQKDYLREYIEESEIRKFNDSIRVRLSKELACKYDEGLYNNYLNFFNKCYGLIKKLDIKLPGNAQPKVYIYIVPEDNYAKLLKIPDIFNNGKGGGRPVPCYDLDGFNVAFGISQNLCILEDDKEVSISREVNLIHEIAHLIQIQYFSKNRLFSEGFAEAIPLYVLDYEKIFKEHRDLIKNLKEEDYLSAQDVLNSEKDKSFGSEAYREGKSCSFRVSYVSAYLFVAGCIELIKNKFNFSKIEAAQKYLEIIKHSTCTNEWLIFDIANVLDIDKEELLNGKVVQKLIIDKI